MKSLFLSAAVVAGFFGVQAAAPRLTRGGAEPVAPAPVPGTPATDMRTTQLRADLEEIIGRPNWNGDRWSVLVVSLDRGDTLYQKGSSDQLTPASNMKLFTTAAALYYLGPDFRYNTFLMTTGTIQDSVLTGDVVIYGTGDPTFSDRFGNKLRVWEAFADTLKSLGVRQITGDIVGDGSYFEGPGNGNGWQPNYMNASYAANAGALSFAENVALIQVKPGAAAGLPAEVRFVPGGDAIAVVNKTTTTASGRGRISAARAAYDGPIIVSGRIGRKAGAVMRSVPISDPAQYAAAAFREVLLKREVAVGGKVRSALTEAESPVTNRSVYAPALDSQSPVRVLAIHTSPPLIDIIEIINKKSHNLMAEQVLRTIGRVAIGTGSVDAGSKAVQHMLTREGHQADLSMHDGSGLSILNRTSAHGIVELLDLMSESPNFELYWKTLPEAGTAGGLRRMYRTDAERNLHAKTGTIDHVSALSGYVTAANGERLAFSIISNNVPSTWMAKRVEDAIGARIASFERPLVGAVTPMSSEPVAAPAEEPRKDEVKPAKSTKAKAKAPAAKTTARTHKIKSGDTLSEIAQKYGTTVKKLQSANPGLTAKRLVPGKTIKLPS